MRLRPVTMTEIVGGQTYTYLMVYGGGQMLIEHLRFYGKPRKNNGTWAIRTAKRKAWERKNLDQVLNFEDASGSGLDPQDRYNARRIFRTTMQNDQILKDLVRRKALGEYLDLIGASKEEREFVAKLELWNTDDDYWDDPDLDSDPEPSWAHADHDDHW